MDWVSELIILVLFILLVLAIEKVDERGRDCIKRLKEVEDELKKLKEISKDENIG